METKQCRNCGETKPLDAFTVARGKPEARCKACRAVIERNRRDAARVQVACKDCGKPIAKLTAQLDAWEGRCRQCGPIHVGRLRAAAVGTEKRCEQCGETKPLAAFPLYTPATGRRDSWCNGCISAYQRGHRQAHIDQYRAYLHRRRVRLQGNGGSYTAAEWQALKAVYGHRCLLCGRQEPEIKLTVDHVIPVKRGGSNSITNLQPLCGPCNRHKGTRVLDLRKAS